MTKANDFIHQETTLPAGERHNQIRLTLPNNKVISISHCALKGDKIMTMVVSGA